MDRLEKEWFDLVGPNYSRCDETDLHSKTKHIPKPDLALPSEDSTCAICDDSEGENSNAIVFCDGCNLAVHQGARAHCPLHLPISRFHRLLWHPIYSRRSMAVPQVYSIPWKSSGKLGSPFLYQLYWLFFKRCILCPNEGGAFKQTVHGEWVHLLCTIWIPETRVTNEVFMEPVDGVEKISKQRWKLVSHLYFLNNVSG